jgi:hypothetical protein
MRDNIKKEIFRIYIIIWGLWFLMGFSDFFYLEEITRKQQSLMYLRII